MAFEFLTWVLEAGLSASAKGLTKGLWNKTLNGELNKAISTWASQLPAEAQLHPPSLIPQAVDHEELAMRSALRALQEQLHQRRMPTLVQWHQALIEHWLRIRCHAGADAQPFFRLSEEAARPRLFELAGALVRVCENEETFFRSTVMEHLAAIREDVPLLPVPLQHVGEADLKGLATRISDMGVGVFLVLHDLPTKTLLLWVDVPRSTMADLKFKWAAIAVVASAAPDIEYIELGTCNVNELAGTDARGPIGTMRVRIPIGAARELASSRRLAAEFWQHASVFLIEPSSDNSAYQHWFQVPFSNLEVPLASSR